MESFESVANKVVVYKIREAWLNIAKLYNELASEYDASISMAFILLAIDQKEGTPVTKIAPRMGMEPNSLSRSLKTLEDQGMILRKKDKVDKRKVYIKLTEQGAKMRVIALKAVFNSEKTIIKDIPKEKLEIFFEVINHVPEAIKEFRNKLSLKEVS
ncbi:MAG: MarR family transcriptional regulator [Chitinophagales bacterium]